MSTIDKVIFELPLYAKFQMPPDEWVKAQLVGKANVNIDGYCVGCGKVSTLHCWSQNAFNTMTDGAKAVVESLNLFLRSSCSAPVTVSTEFAHGFF
ncbi:MAG: hypothetical protein GY767_06820 [Shimia sp.]|nr:hypothetical protein [Shimia sp.]